MFLRSQQQQAGDIPRDEFPVRSALVSELVTSIDLIKRLDDLTFRRRANGTGSIGEQLRHNIDVVNSFLNGVDIGRIDYTKRERDARNETDRRFAIQSFERSIERLQATQRYVLNGSVSVRSEAGGRPWLPSSVYREMEYVLSHAIHHHALIREKLAGFGLELNKNFGVAPSTAEYRRRLAA